MEEAELRAEWRRRVDDRLPALAAARPQWPIRLNHCFARVILDSVHGRPWREVLPPPAWRSMDVTTLRRAVALADDIEQGRVDLGALNRRSLAMRRKLR